MDPATAATALRAEQGIAAAALRAEQKPSDPMRITCPLCGFVAVNYSQLCGHILGHLASAQARPAAQPPVASVRDPAPFKRPLIGTSCKPADWANFLAAWERYHIGTPA